MIKKLSAIPTRFVEIVGTFIVSAIFSFFVTVVLISSSYTVLSGEEHQKLLNEINDANSKASDSEWKSKHDNEKLKEISHNLKLAQSQITEMKKDLRSLKLDYANASEILKQVASTSEKCNKEKGSFTRLTCYERISTLIKLAKKDSQQNHSSVETKGFWKLTQHRTQSNELITVLISANAEFLTTEAHSTKQPSLNLQCNQKEANVYIDWGFEIDGNNIKLLTQFDQDPAVKKTWTISKTGHHTFAPGNSQRFIENLIAHKHFLAQIRNSKDQPVLANFNLKDLESVIEPLRTACSL